VLTRHACSSESGSPTAVMPLRLSITCSSACCAWARCAASSGCGASSRSRSAVPLGARQGWPHRIGQHLARGQMPDQLAQRVGVLLLLPFGLAPVAVPHHAGFGDARLRRVIDVRNPKALAEADAARPPRGTL